MLRKTHKYRSLLTWLAQAVASLRSSVAAREGYAALRRTVARAKDNEAAYWQAAQAGLAYDADAGWYVAETPATPAAGSKVGVRLEGSHAAIVAAEQLLREAGFVILTRSGPTPGRSNDSLTYLSVRLPRRPR